MGEVSADDKSTQPNRPSANTSSKPVQGLKGYGSAPSEKQDVVTHPVASLTPYQNKLVYKVTEKFVLFFNCHFYK